MKPVRCPANEHAVLKRTAKKPSSSWPTCPLTGGEQLSFTTLPGCSASLWPRNQQGQLILTKPSQTVSQNKKNHFPLFKGNFLYSLKQQA